MEQSLVNLEEPTERHPQLGGRPPFPAVPVAAVESQLCTASRFLGTGSFCRVWSVPRWWYERSEASGLPVVIKVISAGFKEGLAEKERRDKQYSLRRHWYREVNAHLLLQGQPRVVRVFHTFKGSMMVPPTPADSLQQARGMEVYGLVEELCSETSLWNFLHSALPQPCAHQLWPLHHAAAEFAVLASQLGELMRMGLFHQDINMFNIMVHLPTEPGSLPVLKLGDLNGAQWQELTRDGGCWIGTVGFMPYRVRQLYLGKQAKGPNVGELNYDMYQLGKTLVRVLLHMSGVHVSYVRGKECEELEAEEAAVKGAAVQLLSTAEPPGEPERELWVFGVLIGLLMCWDRPYTSAADQLRLAPAQAAEVLGAWAQLCNAWQRAPGELQFWDNSDHIAAMARLYLRLAELARLPPLNDPLDAAVHTQTCEYVTEVTENFFLYGSCPNSQRLKPIKAKVQAILEERKAAEKAAAAAAAAMAEAEAQKQQQQQREQKQQQHERHQQAKERPVFRTAWEKKLWARAEAEEAYFDASTSSPAPRPPCVAKARRQGENVAANQGLGMAHKRKPGAAALPAATAAAAKKPKPAAAAAAAAKPGDAAAVGAADNAVADGGGAVGSQDDTLVLNSLLRLKHLYGNAQPPANPPQIIGDKHAVAVMLGDTVRAAAASSKASEVRLQLGAGCSLRFVLAARRSVQFSKRELVALAGDAEACKRWNSFVAAALAAWQAQGKEGSKAERLRLLQPLLG